MNALYQLIICSLRCFDSLFLQRFAYIVDGIKGHLILEAVAGVRTSVDALNIGEACENAMRRTIFEGDYGSFTKALVSHFIQDPEVRMGMKYPIEIFLLSFTFLFKFVFRSITN